MDFLSFILINFKFYKKKRKHRSMKNVLKSNEDVFGLLNREIHFARKVNLQTKSLNFRPPEGDWIISQFDDDHKINHLNRKWEFFFFSFFFLNFDLAFYILNKMDFLYKMIILKTIEEATHKQLLSSTNNYGSITWKWAFFLNNSSEFFVLLVENLKMALKLSKRPH